ncbi:hypothetical protein GQ44DRAFT_731038 [Phaeosphaeriaceae sp. PMI808]|nr:hypothetical protein GQ44DRAFT_731038 [Phaeosphaeriaceae sp. PMI808]
MKASAVLFPLLAYMSIAFATSTRFGNLNCSENGAVQCAPDQALVIMCVKNQWHMVQNCRRKWRCHVENGIGRCIRPQSEVHSETAIGKDIMAGNSDPPDTTHDGKNITTRQPGDWCGECRPWSPRLPVWCDECRTFRSQCLEQCYDPAEGTEQEHVIIGLTPLLDVVIFVGKLVPCLDLFRLLAILRRVTLVIGSSQTLLSNVCVTNASVLGSRRTKSRRNAA